MNQSIVRKNFLGYFDGKNFKFFEGQIEGIIKKTNEGKELDKMFYPSSYPLSLKEMKDYKYIFSERKKTLLRLFQEIRKDLFCSYILKLKNKENNVPSNSLKTSHPSNPPNSPFSNKSEKIRKLPQYKEYKGIFEIHVTVEFDSQSENEKNLKVELFKKLCNQNKLKAVLILLENQKGEHTNLNPQMMTSSYHCCSSLFGNSFNFNIKNSPKKKKKEIQKKTFSIAKIFAKKSFKIVRTKCESIYSNEGVPEEEESANLFHCPLNYFEFHFKIFFPNESKDSLLKKVEKICKENDSHLSKNAFKKSENGEKKFVTCRIYKKGKDFANQRFELLKNLLKKEKLQIESSLKEYSIYDSNVHLDKGWIN